MVKDINRRAMDPNSLSNLDPKLKETYDRVMGTSSPTPANQPQPTPTPAPAQPTAGAPANIASSVNPTPGATELTPPVDNVSSAASEPHPETVTISQPTPEPAPSNIINQQHGHSGLIRVFYILGATVFFVIYIFFWAKIFNIALPF